MLAAALGGLSTGAVARLGVPSAAAAGGPALRGVSTVANNGTTFTASAPARETAGDVLVAALQINGSGTIGAPTGWTLLGSTRDGGDGTYSWYKVVGSGEPLSYTWTSTSSSNGSIAILDYTGINTTMPVNAWVGNSGLSSNAVAPAVTTTATTVSVVLVTWDGAPSSLTVTTPANFTQRWFLHSY
jgi:hypothetical protein